MALIHYYTEHVDNPKRLGRHVEHDERSLNYPVAGLPLSSLKTVRWTRRIPILDQEDLHKQGIEIGPDALGSCTANAGVGFIGTDNIKRQGLIAFMGSAINERFAIDLYSSATKLDGIADNTWPALDEGSTGLGVVKALKKLGLVRTYKHCFSAQAIATALQTGPVLLGITWTESMFHCDSAGRVEIKGEVAGGHELCIEGYDAVDREFLLANSWSESFGKKGYLVLTFSQMVDRMSANGDAILPLP